MSTIILQFFENKTINKYNKYWISGVAVIYFLVIFNTLYWYFSPFPLLETVFQEFRQHSLIIQELIIIFIALPMIPGFIVVKKAYNKLRLKKVPIPAILMISTPIPLFAFVNNCLTGNFLLSMILLIYGVLFSLLAFRFR